MSFKLIRLASELEQSDDLHEARLLLLLGAATDYHTTKPVDGIMKLAKMDFLLRYPNVLARVLECLSESKPRLRKAAAHLTEDQKDTIEGRMIRFRYGPWDKRYRKWLSILAAKGLIIVSKHNRTIKVFLTDKGAKAASRMATLEDFVDVATRAETVKKAVGAMPATKLKEFIYSVAPELLTMKWGENIKI
jgi:hypothetical protein